MECIVDGDVVLSRPLEGPLSMHIAAFAAWSRQEGYPPRSRWRRVHLANGFSRWLGQRAISPPHLAAEHVTRYLRSRARHVQIQSGDAAALNQFLEFLRRQGAIPPESKAPPRPTPVEKELQGFTTYLVDERSLVQATVNGYVRFIHKFLTHRYGKGRVTLSRLSAADVQRFVQRQVPSVSRKRAKTLTTALRSFLQYARYRGYIDKDLATVVPCVANWSMSSIPRAIPPETVRRLLTSIDRHTAGGRRDYAILLLLARLGLRAGEVAFLELDDFDWVSGELSVQGKGGYRKTLPLSVEVGKAVVDYLRHGRPSSTSRRLFLRRQAPIRGFRSSVAVASVVRSALARAGIQAPTTGAHQFRHALATQMLRQGASLSEIGMVLGHRDPQTTMIYAKVDLDALRSLALPWPGGVR